MGSISAGSCRSLGPAAILCVLQALTWSCGRAPEAPGGDAIGTWMGRFRPSTLDDAAMRRELEWFARAARPFRGIEVRSAAEDIATHRFESEVLAPAFEEITGIRVRHDTMPEGALVDKLLEQMETKRRFYEIYVNDADLVGTHLRAGSALDLSDYMAGEGRDVTNPDLDLDDFLNPEFGQDYGGRQLQLPDQQFVNLYWFRHDWFSRDDLKAEFRARYGYELGVPVNWAAYRDIAEFFTGKTVDGRRVWGHMDYGKKSPSLGWRFTDAWLAMAGVGDRGLPNGSPVDEWGIRTEAGIPVGCSVSRGGELNGPAAVYALDTYVDWLRKFAPPEAMDMTWSEAGPVPGRGDIAQAVFQYTNFLSDESFTSPGSPVVGADGLPLWRVAPSPHGKYWEDGMKAGYMDAGSWTILRHSVKGDDRKAAWLWAQFCVSKTVSLRKFLAGWTPVRKSTVASELLLGRDASFGGLISFYNSPDARKWTGTGRNVPHYPLLSQLWWRTIADAVSGDKAPKAAMDELAFKMDAMMGRMSLGAYSPSLNPERDGGAWLSASRSPKAERPEERPRTVPYEKLLEAWRGGGREAAVPVSGAP